MYHFIQEITSQISQIYSRYRPYLYITFDEIKEYIISKSIDTSYIFVSSPILSKLILHKPVILDSNLPLLEYDVQFNSPDNKRIDIVTVGIKKKDTNTNSQKITTISDSDDIKEDDTPKVKTETNEGINCDIENTTNNDIIIKRVNELHPVCLVFIIIIYIYICN